MRMGLCANLACSMVIVTSAMAAPPKPNIVFILADDLGWTDLSGTNTNMGHNSDYYRTPNIDMLMAKGMSFDHAYASPNSAPARASLMTGQYAPRHGMYTVGDPNRVSPMRRSFNAAANSKSIAGSSVMLPEMLKSAGYDTYHLGKWHLGKDGKGTGPTDQGFDVNFGGNHSGSIRSHYATKQGDFYLPNIKPNGKPYQYFADRMTEEALDYLAARDLQQDQDPFFLFMSHYAVHIPLHNAPAEYEKLEGRPVGARHDHQTYASMIENLDNNVGRVVAYLESTDDIRNPGNKLIDNTIVIFCSDNGGVGGFASADIHDLEITDNAPLKGGKGTLSEGGIRIPLIIRWDGKIQPNAISKQTVSSVDFYTTFSDIVKAETPEQPLDGISLLPVLTGQKHNLQDRAIFLHFPAYLEAQQDTMRARPGTVMHKGTWKLIYHYETQQYELYNLAEDLSETQNVIDSRQDIASEMSQEMIQWLQQIKADLPTDKETGELIPLPLQIPMTTQ